MKCETYITLFISMEMIVLRIKHILENMTFINFISLIAQCMIVN